MIPAAIWLFVEGDTVGGVFLTVVFIVVIGLDEPILIRRGADLPLLLILLGIIGGPVTFGLIGILLGPTILVVVYTLALAWISESQEAAPARPDRAT